MSQGHKGWLRKVIEAVLLFVVFYVGFLFLLQEKIIYHPRSYSADYQKIRPENLIELQFETSSGPQVCYFLPPKGKPAASSRVWVLFNGNAALALDWLFFLNRFEVPNDGYLLIEYPGYGSSAGAPSPESILEASEGALVALSKKLEVPSSELEKNLAVFGNSLGSGAGLQFAVNHPVKTLILLAPFTSLRDMAARRVSPLLTWLLRHHFDNDLRLDELATRESPPEVVIFHGLRDRVIPSEMSQLLAKRHPEIIRHFEIPHSDHNSLLTDVGEQIVSSMK